MTVGTTLIVGASRGIGAELVRQYVAAGWQVHATVRDISSPGEVAATDTPVALHRLEVRARDELAALIAELPVLDLVIHNAGVYRGVTAEDMYAVNAEAPIRVAGALLDARRVRPGGTVAFMSSGMGSRRGRSDALGTYGESKARLNEAVRANAPTWLAEHGAVAVVLNPGWVRTDMGGPGAPLSVERAVEGLHRVLTGIGPEDAGRFLNWDGSEQPW